MQNNIKILAFSGSIRKQSFNSLMLRYTVDFFNATGVDVTLLNLHEYPLPIYNGDLEKSDGLPENCMKIKKLMQSHHGFVIACPEYNGSITPLLKNVLDWASRAIQDEQPLSCYKGKVVGLLSASPGALGGMRGLVHMRDILKNLGCLVIPEQVNIANAAAAFSAEGKLLDDKNIQKVKLFCDKMAEITRKLN
jgi:NAD(P)H-dependent FMN reductase